MKEISLEDFLKMDFVAGASYLIYRDKKIFIDRVNDQKDIVSVVMVGPTENGDFFFPLDVNPEMMAVNGFMERIENEWKKALAKNMDSPKKPV